jgi:ATP-dependent RNA helicase DHX29
LLGVKNSVLTISLTDTPLDTPLASGATTPRFLDIDPKLGSKIKNGALSSPSPRTTSPKPKKPTVTFDEDIEPEDLLPTYLESKTKLFEIQRPKQEIAKGKGRGAKKGPVEETSPEEALLQAKISRVEKDVLFDRAAAEHQWRTKRVVLEKEYAANKQKAVEEKEKVAPFQEANGFDGVNEEAERIAAEILAEAGDDDDDDDAALADLFASLPVNEVDPITGKTNTVMNGSDGTKTVIRDFGKWSGNNPSRTLEEACRARLVPPHLDRVLK